MSPHEYFPALQQRIVAALETCEGQPFRRDEWTRPEGGGGVSCLIEDGKVFERAGVLFSRVTGDKLPRSATAHRPELAGRTWEALGVSLVLHPRNPYAPTVHLNVRHFVANKPGTEPVWWFGGGMDLTPCYGFEEDAVHFHRTCRDALAPFGPDVHPRYKQWCDEYFYLKHRQEPRGIGGIFFDDLAEGGFERSFALTQSVGDHFLDAYLPLLQRRKDMPYGERERDFQCYRRGRYVEFNLVWDRGTLFGLQSNGRTEAILLSLPPVVNWRYDWEPKKVRPRRCCTSISCARAIGWRWLEHTFLEALTMSEAQSPDDSRLIETRLDGESLFDGKLLHARRDRVQLPDGSVTTREYIVHPGAVCMVPKLDDGRYIVERQYRYPLQRVFIEFPAGKIDAGEEPLATGKRELLEETGYTAERWTHLGEIHPVISYSTEVIHIWLAEGLAHVGSRLDAGEFLQIITMSHAEMLDALDRGEITDSKTVAALFFLERHAARPMRAERLTIRGRVQGVGFRYGLMTEAAAEGLTGWVRNRRDGTVEAHLQGDADAVERVATWARRGPPAAQVTAVERTAVDIDPAHTGFAQRPGE